MAVYLNMQGFYLVFVCIIFYLLFSEPACVGVLWRACCLLKFTWYARMFKGFILWFVCNLHFIIVECDLTVGYFRLWCKDLMRILLLGCRSFNISRIETYISWLITNCCHWIHQTYCIPFHLKLIFPLAIAIMLISVQCWITTDEV